MDAELELMRMGRMDPIDYINYKLKSSLSDDIKSPPHHISSNHYPCIDTMVMMWIHVISKLTTDDNRFDIVEVSQCSKGVILMALVRETNLTNNERELADGRTRIPAPAHGSGGDSRLLLGL